MAEIAELAAHDVTFGASVDKAADAIAKAKVTVCCGIGVENWTRSLLDDPKTKVEGGQISIPAESIVPAHREDMVAQKTAIGATGSYGTVSWKMRGKDRRVVVMWSMPFNHDFFDNWLGLGITKAGNTEHGQDWFDQMYNKKPVNNLHYKIKKYADMLDELKIEDEEFEVVGTMGSTHKTLATITIRPKNDKDLAEPIRRALEKMKKVPRPKKPKMIANRRSSRKKKLFKPYASPIW